MIKRTRKDKEKILTLLGTHSRKMLRNKRTIWSKRSMKAYSQMDLVEQQAQVAAQKELLISRHLNLLRATFICLKWAKVGTLISS